MSDLSAGRPSTPSQKLFSEEDFDLARSALDTVGRFGEIATRSAIAEAVLTALAAAGRLLPASSEHREEEEEFAVVGALPDGTPWESDPHYRLGDARQLAALMAPGAVIRRRMIAAGSWTEVEGSPTE